MLDPQVWVRWDDWQVSVGEFGVRVLCHVACGLVVALEGTAGGARVVLAAAGLVRSAVGLGFLGRCVPFALGLPFLSERVCEFLCCRLVRRVVIELPRPRGFVLHARSVAAVFRGVLRPCR